MALSIKKAVKKVMGKKKVAVKLEEYLASTGKQYATAELCIMVGDRVLKLGEFAQVRIRPGYDEGCSTAHVQIHSGNKRDYGLTYNIQTKTNGLFAKSIPAEAKGE